MAQNLSNAVWAVATLKDTGHFATVDMEMVSSMCTRFMDSVNSQHADTPATSQAVSISSGQQLHWISDSKPQC